MITQKYNLDLVPSGVPVIVRVSQYDSDSRTIEMTMYEEGTAFTVPVGSVVTCRGTKKDLTGFEVACTFSGSVVSFDIDAQMTVFDGDVPCEIRIVDTNSDIIGSANFILRVEQTPLDSSIVISSTLLPLVEDASQNAAIAQAAAAQAVSVLSTAVKSVNSVLPDNNGNVDVVALPVGGTADQYLVKQSSTDGDADWETREVSLTQPQYNAITPDPKVTYYITDSNVNPTTASNVTYDNTSSGLSASTVQTAIDELASGKSTITYTTKSITTDTGGNIFLSNTPNILNVFVLGVSGERYMRLHTYNSSIYGRLFDGSGNVQASTTVTIGIISYQ